MYLLVDYGKVLCSTANELHQNSDGFFKEEYVMVQFYPWFKFYFPLF